MRLLNRTLPALLLSTITVTAFAQTAPPDPAGVLLDEQIKGMKDSRNTPGNALILALYEAKMKGSDRATRRAQLRDAINRQRTDMQLEAASDSPHATSVLEKPGIADLLSLALDRGAIKKTPNGTGLTLSTTPYAIWTGFGARDTPQAWEKAAVARNLSLSATFSSTDVTAGDFSSFTSGEVKYVIAGNRSPRDEALLGSVRSNLAEVFRAADHSADVACNRLLDTKLFEAQGSMNSWLHDPANAGKTEDEIGAQLDSVVREQTVGPEELQPCVDAILAGEESVKGGLDAVTEATKKYLADNPQQLSVAALFVRDATISDYYVAKLLYGYDRDQLTVNLNAEASWNKESTAADGAQIRSLRAYSVELGVTSKTFAKGRLDGSLSSKASRDKAADAKSVVIGEAKLNVHLTDVLRLPVTLNYANRETQTVKQGWQLNVGLNALLDGVLSALR